MQLLFNEARHSSDRGGRGQRKATPPASIALSTFAPSTFAHLSFAGGVTLEAIMAKLVCMDARLDTLSDELCQVNTRVSRIARR